jgi:hypothetical protein
MENLTKDFQDHSSAEGLYPDRSQGKKIGLTIQLLVFFLILPACASTRYVTHTKKSGVEQLLIARSLEGALRNSIMDVKGARIFIEIASLLPEQDPYVKRALEHWFLKNGALLTEERKKADHVASVLVKCAGTDGNEFNIGIPSLPVPMVNVTTPQISFISGSIQKGCVEMELVLYSPESVGQEQKMTLAGHSHFKKYMILFIPITRENIYKNES